MDTNEFERDRTIDPSQLDLEAVRQADVFFKWAEKSIQAKTALDNAKLFLDTTEARLNIEVREAPERFNLTKVTEASVQAAVRTNQRYIDAYEAYIRAREVSGILEKAVEAMDQRKRMIEILVTLHGQQYFAGPSVPRDLVGAWTEYQQALERQVNERQAVRVRRKGEKRDD